MSTDTKPEGQITSEDIEKAERFKNEANEYFKGKVFQFLTYF